MYFGGSLWRWLLDTISGYNQIRVAKSSQIKLGIAGPDCSKCIYIIMPFGPFHGPKMFIVFIHDLNSTWRDLAHICGIIIDPRLELLS